MGSQVRGSFQVDSPARVLRARWAKESPVRQFHRFVFDGTGYSLWKAARLRPGGASIFGSDEHAPPGRRTGSDLVEEQQRPRLGLKQDRIPTRKPFLVVRLHTVGDSERGGP